MVERPDPIDADNDLFGVRICEILQQMHSRVGTASTAQAEIQRSHDIPEVFLTLSCQCFRHKPSE
eukprot:9491908-Pyramimonas_sp.AAC.1